jgi:hypothetical protein
VARAQILFFSILGASLAVGSCKDDPAASPLIGPTPGAGECADVFSEDRVTTYEIQIAPSDWEGLVSDFYNMPRNDAANLDIHPYHPLAEFRYGNDVVTDAMIRLKGQSSWRESLEAGDNPPKLQFVISFNENDPTARFHGLRKLELDMPRIDRSYLRERVALSYLRALGLPAQCANSARLMVNGAYFGLYTNLERPDQEFLQRMFPGQDEGDLWDGGWGLQTNTDTRSQPKPRMDAWQAVRTTADLVAIADVDAALAEWAGEAMILNSDGFWIGRQNFFLYDHPTRGWLWIPHDLDATIDWIDPRTDPLFYWGKLDAWDKPWPHYAAVINDPATRDRYVAALHHATDAFAAAKLPELVDRYAAQIADAAAADPTRPFTVDQHVAAVKSVREALVGRGAALQEWLACSKAPTAAADADGDGRPFCLDCNDGDPAAYPGATETCGDGRDQSCDGSATDGC